MIQTCYKPKVILIILTFYHVCSWMMGSHQFVQKGKLDTQACGMEIILLKSVPIMGFKDLPVLAITGLLVKKPYLIPYVFS